MARDWVDEILNAAEDTPVGRFAVVVRAGGMTTKRAVYDAKSIALGQAARQAGGAGNGYVVQRIGERLVIWLSADTTLRIRVLSRPAP